jgi:PAS domain S-box-containing protein
MPTGPEGEGAGDWPPGTDERAQRVRAFDWAATPLGPIERWPRSLRTAVEALLASGQVRGNDVTEQRRAEDALRESEERLRLALEAGLMGTWRFDLQSGRQQWSEQQFKLFGLDPGGEPPSRELFLSLVHPDDRRQVEFGPQDLLPGRGLLDAEFRIVRPDGAVRWLVAHTTVRRDEHGVAREMIGVNWDITSHKRDEEALRESELGLRMALEAGRMGTYRFNVHTGIEQWSDSEYELLGLKPTDGAPTRELFLSIVHPDDLHLVQYTEGDRRPEGTPLDSEFRIIRPDTGEVRHITAHALARFGSDGKPVELIGVNQDVTEERKARAARQTSEERLQQFSDASSDVLWIREAHSMQWEYLSPAFDKIYGLTRQDALRGDNYRSWLDLIMPEDRATADAAIDRVRSGARVAFEYRIRRPDGEIRWLRNTDFPMRDAHGAVTHIGGVGSDITLLKQAEEHQRVLLGELQHRVRNTLAVIRSIMRRTAATAENKEEFFTHLDGRVAAFARIQSAVTRDPTRGIDLGLLIADELRVVGAQEGRELTLNGPLIALKPKAAETLGLAVHELATNAIKHGALAQPEGRIEIAWAVAGSGLPELQLSWTEHGAVVTPVVAPRRRGFGTEMLEHALAYELKGSSQTEFRPSGFRCVLRVPLDQLTSPISDAAAAWSEEID